MKTALLTLFVMTFFLQNSFADNKNISEINSIVKKVGEPPCADCEAKKGNSHSGKYELPTTARSKRDTTFFNERCKNFIGKGGKYGPWGEEIETYINKKGREDSVYLSNKLPGMSDAPFTCPNWRKLSADDKINFWVWFKASIAMVESSCDPTAVNKGSNVPDRADLPRGLVQLNSQKKERSWRGDNCKFASNSTEPLAHIRCSMDISGDLIGTKKYAASKRYTGKLFPTNSYWEKLRPGHSSNGGPIGKLVRRFPPCGAKE